MPRHGEPGGVAIAMMVIWLILSVIASWVLGNLVKGLGSGEVSAEGVLMVATTIGAPAVALLFVGLALNGVQPLVRLSGLGLALLVINAGLLCQGLAVPMDSRYYDYSLLDKHPRVTGGVLVTAGLAGAAAFAFGHRLRRRQPDRPN